MIRLAFFIFLGLVTGCASNVESRINSDLAELYVRIEKIYATCLQVTPLNKIVDCGNEYIDNLNKLPPHPQLAVELRYAYRLRGALIGVQYKKNQDWSTYNEMNAKFTAQYHQELKVALAKGNYVGNYPSTYSGSLPSRPLTNSANTQPITSYRKDSDAGVPSAFSAKQRTPLVNSSGDSLGSIDTGGGFNSHGTIYDNNGNFSGKVDMGGGFNSNGSTYDKNGNYIGKVAPK